MDLKQILYVVVGLLVLIALAKFILHLNLSKIFGLVVNGLIGFAILYVINYFDLIKVPINIVTCLVSGVFGIPGVILVVLLAFLGIIK